MKRLGTSFHYLVFFCAFCFLEFVIILVAPITEKEILLQFKGNISCDPFSSLSSWDQNNSPCRDYRGVVGNSDGNVARIVFWNKSLGGVLSPALSGLKSLKTIDLFGNKFKRNIPLEYGEIDTLWKINLSSNALSGVIPDFLGDLPNIRSLEGIDLSFNSLNGGLATEICGIPGVVYLAVRNNVLLGSVQDNVSE
ncbi:leucine-rich repeat transmembrane protein kinase family protein [Forsythia ovata]|uniref:Leucine-rich repeat transmembrane protein kinase family protein n=1 Tax=Forsythia ovata TaxID=205694 RepID=A0ABD1WCY5_9LAMI